MLSELIMDNVNFTTIQYNEPFEYFEICNNAEDVGATLQNFKYVWSSTHKSNISNKGFILNRNIYQINLLNLTNNNMQEVEGICHCQ